MRTLLVATAALIASVWFASAWTERGIASVYSGGETPVPGVYLSSRDWAVAHKYLKLGTYVRIVNSANGRQVIAPVRDRGPYVHRRVVDVLPRVALALGIYKKGLQLVEISAVEATSRHSHHHHHHEIRSEVSALLDELEGKV